MHDKTNNSRFVVKDAFQSFFSPLNDQRFDL